MRIITLVTLLMFISVSHADDKKNYSSGSKPSSSSRPSSSKPSSSSRPSNSKPSGKSFSSGSKGTTHSDGSKHTSDSRKPSKTIDSAASREQIKAESRKTYEKGSTPKKEYTTPSGKTASIDPKDVKIERLRTQLDHQKWVNRGLRQQQFYGTYYSRPVVIYNDPYPSFFWWWLLDRSIEERAMWAYHHKYDMDQARYQALLAKDSQLEARVRALETRKVQRDTTYVPQGMDSDLMYNDDYVDAVYNPTSDSSWFCWLCGLFFAALVVLMFVYCVFFWRRF